MDLDRFFSSYDPRRDFQFYKENAAPGYRFVATTSEMVFYLLGKEQGHPGANIFQEVHLYDYNPDELQRKFNKGKGDELYLYTKIKPLKNGWRVERKAGSGRWKNLKRGEKITEGDRIAYMTTLTYYVVKNGKEEKTCWNMHEYRLHRKKSDRQMRDDVVLCKIYKRGGAGKTSEAVDEETDGSIGSCSSPQSSTTVSNGLGLISFPDGHSLECSETEDLPTPINGSSDFPLAALNNPYQFAVSRIEDSVTHKNIVYEGFPMADVNHPFQLEESPIEDSVTLMNGCGDFTMADANDPFQFERPPPIGHLAALMNGCGDFTMADVNDPFQFERLLLIEHSAALINGWGDFTVADANEHAIQF